MTVSTKTYYSTPVFYGGIVLFLTLFLILRGMNVSPGVLTSVQNGFGILLFLGMGVICVYDYITFTEKRLFVSKQKLLSKAIVSFVTVAYFLITWSL